MTPPDVQAAGGCAHGNCGCDPTPGDAYCSPYCANADHEGPPEGACACGHAACVASQRVGRTQGEVQTAVGPSDEPEGASSGARPSTA